MAFLTTLGLVTGGAGAVNSFLTGRSMAKQAEMGLAKFRHQELTDLAENLKPSTEVERQLRETAAKQRAAVVDVAQGRDAAEAMAFMSMGLDQIADMELKGFGSMLDKEFQADLVRVQDEQQQRSILEARNMEKLGSLKAQAQSGKQMQASALADFASMVTSAGLAQEYAASEGGDTDPAVRRAARRDARRAAREDRIAKGMGFLGKNTKVGGFLGSIGQSIGSFFN